MNKIKQKIMCFLIMMVLILGEFTNSNLIFANEVKTSGEQQQVTVQEKEETIKEETVQKEENKLKKVNDSGDDDSVTNPKQGNDQEETDSKKETDLEQQGTDTEEIKKEKTDSKNELENKSEENKYKVIINKKVANTDEFLKGVSLSIHKKGEEEAIATWTTKEKSKEFQLPSGEYELVENETVEGYKKENPITFTIKDDGKIDEETTYLGHHEEETIRGLYVRGLLSKEEKAKVEKSDPYKKIDSIEKGRVVYCFNAGKKYPTKLSLGGGVEYKRVIAEGDNSFIKLATKDRTKPQDGKLLLSEEEVNNGIKAAILNGYPFNKSGLQETYGLTDDQFREVTQSAVWYYSDKYDYNLDSFKKFENPQQMLDAYDELIEMRNSDLKDVYLNMYIPKTDSSYQNLLSVEVIKPREITLYNERISKPEKPEESKTQEPKEPKDEKPIAPEEPKKEEPKTEEPKTEEPKTEEPKTEEPKTEEPKKEEPKKEEPKKEEPKKEEPKTEEPKTEEPKTEEPKTEEPKKEEPKKEESKKEEPKKEEPKTEEPKKEEPKKEESKKEEPKKEEPKTEEPKKEEPTKDKSKKEEPKTEMPNKEEAKQEKLILLKVPKEQEQMETSKTNSEKTDNKLEISRTNSEKHEKKKLESVKNDDISPQTFVSGTGGNIVTAVLAMGALEIFRKKRK